MSSPAIDPPAADETLAQALRDDAAARLAALEIESCIVEAPAGAGKTELLTQRFLRLLATVDSPEEVMAITFTNKAAAEMQKRILDNLRAAAEGEIPEAPHKLLTYRLAGEVLATSGRKDWHLLEQPGRLRLTTIDALCASLARQMPLLSRFGASPTVTDDAGPLYEDAARRTLELLESDRAEYAEPVAAALAYLDNDTGRLNHLLSAMLARRDQWLSAVSSQHASEIFDGALAQLVTVELAAIRRALDPAWEARLMPVVRFAVETLLSNGKADSPIVALRDWDQPLAAQIDELPRWRGLVEFLFTGKNEWRKSFTIAVGIPAGKEGKTWKDGLAETLAAAPPQLERILARVRLLPGLTGREAEDEIVGHFATLLKLATVNLWSVFREQGETDFVEVAQRALDALGVSGEEGIDGAGPSDLALRLDYRIRHLLVDEFQDTSPTQIKLLERLTAGWSVGDGRTLFCVGDPMQSIYRFRKADVGLFLRAAGEGIGGLPLTRLRLARNNRSSRPVVDWINRVFAEVFPAADEVAKGSIAYRPAVPTRPLIDAAGVQVHLLEDNVGQDDADAEANRETGRNGEVASGESGVDEELGRDEINRAEAQQILALIDATWAADPARQIAVLVRAKTHLAPLVSEIRSQRPGLSFAAVDVEPLAGRQWIADLLCLSQALQHRADRVSWLAMLRSPLCGLTLADLLVLAGDDQRSTLWSLLNQPARQARLSEDGRQRVAVICRAIGAAYEVLGRMPHSRMVEGLWRQLGGAAGLPDSAASRDVDAFFTLLGQLETRGRLNREQLELELRRLFAAPDPAGAGRLSLMTIHKAKGLEFDTVILPGLHRTVRGNDPEMLLWEEVSLPGNAGSQLIVAPMKPAVAGRSATSALPTAYDFLRRLEKERGRNEDLRVLYVAATRAVRTLHLVGVVSRADDGDALPPANTPLADLWPALSGVERRPRAIPAALAGKNCKSENARSEPTPVLPSWPDFVPALLRQPLPRYAGLLAGVPAGVPAGTASEALSAARQANAAMVGPEDVAAAPESIAAGPPPGADGPAPARRDARQEEAVGTLVHRYLELMANDGGVWPAERCAALRPVMLAWLAGQGVLPATRQAAADRAVGLLGGLVASRLGQWVLAPRPGALQEAALIDVDGMAADRGISVVDRSFVENGERWIIDYKTTPLDVAGRADSPAGEASRQRQAERHREQLARYGRLLAGDGLPQRRAILFVDGPWLTELRPAGG